MYESDNILVHMFDNYTKSKSSIMIYKSEYSHSWQIEVILRTDERNSDEIKLKVDSDESLADALSRMQSKLDAILPNNRRFDPNKSLEYSDVASGDRAPHDDEIPF